MDLDSDSSEESSSTDYTTESSDDDDGMETAEMNGSTLQLPQGLCDKKEIFESVINTGTWNGLSDSNKQYLQTFLPNFPEDDLEEKNRTLQKLFEGDIFKFASPLTKFHDDLKAGYFRPDIANMRRIIQRAERKEADYRYKKLREKLKLDVTESQKKLLDQIKSLPPGVEPKWERNQDPELDYVVHRTKRRYYQILTSIQAKVDNGYCSPDENYPEGPPVPLSRKQRRHLNSINNSYSTEEIFYSTTSGRSSGLDLEKYVTPSKNPFCLTDDAYKTLLVQHKRRKLNSYDDPEMNTKTLTLSDIIHRTRLPYVKNLTPVTSKSDRTSKKRPRKEEICNSDSDSDSFVDAVTVPSKPHRVKSKSVTPLPKPKIVKSEPKVSPPVEVVDVSPIIAAVPTLPITAPTVTNTTAATDTNKQSVADTSSKMVTITDLEGIDMMNLPIDLDNTDIDILDLNKPELMQETHSNFLSLIRDIVCSTGDHRMSFTCLESRLKSWQENPISPLNDWYNLTENWARLLKNAVDFLCGNHGDQPDDFVPYMEHKPVLDVYQWIGAGRDSDSLLAPLCSYWLEHKSGGNKMAAGCVAAVKKELKDDVDNVEVSDRSQTPPPPRCPTNWTVRKATSDEVRDFREQERKRYDNPHKAFTYRCYGYESVVGPLKGIYNPSVGNSSKARGHTMLNADRPNFVTILSLVRDATSRLPNGEGTRAEICELLKSSQYISSTAPDNVLQTVVSGALDRMHTQFDPCVKYDSKRKIWIYLHRNRSEEDFERIHQQYQGVNKSKKTTAPKKISQSNRPKVAKKASPVTAPVTCPPVKIDNSERVVVKTSPPPPPVLIQRHHNSEQTVKDQKEINEALQAIVQKCQSQPNNVVKNPTNATVVNLNKRGLVKIISPGGHHQGKSLIIPSTSSVGKQMQEVAKHQTVTTQQLLQNIQNKQKLIQNKQSDAPPSVTSVVKETTKAQPIIQSITPQQLSNIKNVTLVRNVTTTSPLVPNQRDLQTPKIQEQQQIQIKTQGTLTVAQQQQIIQTLKQKILPQGSVLTTAQQQQPQQQHNIVLKQQKPGASLLGQIKSVESNKTQAPVVAKVLTNAAGQVISVESLLAHQKQHGSLPQGTTLRVSGTKGGQPNIIQLTAGGTSQNNIIAIAGQPKLVMTSSQPPAMTTAVTAATTVSRVAMVNKAQTVTGATTKLNPKVAQQLINAKVITTAQLTAATGDGNKPSQPPKIFVSQPNQLRLAGKGGTANTIRMVNAANLNLTHIGGKPVLLAGKGGTLQNIQGQNLILQTQANTSGLVLQGAVKPTTASSASNVVLGQQIKLPQHQQVIFKNAANSTAPSPVAVQGQQGQGQIVLEGHPVRLQTGAAGSSSPHQQRVVLASQGQGGQIVAQQILLPAGFQGTAINIKALQGIKVIPLAQAHGQARGVQSRQVFARVMSPGVVKTIPVGTTASLPTTQTTEKLPDPVISTPE